MVKLFDENDGRNGTMGNELTALSVEPPSSTMSVTVADRGEVASSYQITKIILKIYPNINGIGWMDESNRSANFVCTLCVVCITPFSTATIAAAALSKQTQNLFDRPK